MPSVCEICAKGPVFGRNIRHQHAGRWERKAPRTPRTFSPNVHVHRFQIDGKTVRLAVCAQCLKTMLKQPRSRSPRPRP